MTNEINLTWEEIYDAFCTTSKRHDDWAPLSKKKKGRIDKIIRYARSKSGPINIAKPVIEINFFKPYHEVIDDILSIPVIDPIKSYEKSMDECLDFGLSLLEDDANEAEEL